MPAPLHADAVAYLKQQGIPVNTQSLNRTMGLLNQQPDLRPSYAGQTGALDVDVDTMSPIRETGPLPPLQANSNTDMSFGQTFADARKRLGPTGEFDYKGKKYNTRYKDEPEANNPQSNIAGGEDIDKFGDDIGETNQEADEDVRSRLSEERLGNKDGSSAPPTLNRGNVSSVSQANDDMEKMLAAIGIGAAGTGALAYGMSRNKTKDAQQPMSRGDLYTKPRETGVMSNEDLYGEPDKTQKMTDSDVFNDDQTRKMVPGDIEMSLQDEFEQNVKSGEYVDEEAQAVQAIKTKNKVQARNLLPKLKNLGADKRLITALKAIM